MFKQLEQFLDDYRLSLVMEMKEGKISVSVIPGKKDGSESKISPLVLTGTAEQLDAGFISALSSKIPVNNELVIISKQYDASVKEEKELEIKAKKQAEKGLKAVSKGTPKENVEPEKKSNPKAEASEFARIAHCAMTDKDYKSAVTNYGKAIELVPDEKKYKDGLTNAMRWQKAVNQLNDNKETITASNPNQASLLDEPGVIICKPEPIEAIDYEPCFDDAEGPEEGVEDNGNSAEEDEDFNFS